MFEIIIYFIFILFFSILAKNKNFLPNYTGNFHQKFIGRKNTPLVGGFYFLVLISYVFYEINLLFVIICTLIYLSGFSSDTNLLSSPKFRFLIQLILISVFVFYQELNIKSTRIDFLDEILINSKFGLFFSIFCLLILINGSNFIDGLNGLLLGYLFLIFLILENQNLFFLFNINNDREMLLIYSILILLVLNYLNFFYLGDGGSYLIGFILGYFLISIYNISTDISPYYIILILWYPCFETLFSLLRKIVNNKSPLAPDNLHLHQLLYFFVMKKFGNKNHIIFNNFSSLIINIFNFLILSLGTMNKNLTSYQIALIVTAISIYIIAYLYLNSFRKYSFGIKK